MTDIERLKIEQQISESIAITAKIQAETLKINREYYWYPIMVTAGLVGATATIVKLFF